MDGINCNNEVPIFIYKFTASPLWCKTKKGSITLEPWLGIESMVQRCPDKYWLGGVVDSSEPAHIEWFGDSFVKN